MNTYRVIGFADGNVQMPQGIELTQSTGSRFHLKSQFDVDRFGVHRHTGVRIVADIPRPLLDEALAVAGGTADVFLGAIAITAGTHAGWMKPWVVYDITPGKSDRDFVQFIYDQDGLPRKEVRNVNTVALATLIEQIDKLDEAEYLRLSDAMHWYNSARREALPFHEFTSLWLGLESLEPILRKRLDAQPDLAKCANDECDVTFPRSETVGIKALASKAGVAVFKRLKAIRVGAIHAARRLPDVNDDAKRSLEEIDQLLRSGVATVTEIDVDVGEAKRMQARHLDYSVKIKAVLHGLDPNNLGIDGEPPYFELAPLGSVSSPDGSKAAFVPISHMAVPADIVWQEFPEHMQVSSVEQLDPSNLQSKRPG